jgi:hypothetical protein
MQVMIGMSVIATSEKQNTLIDKSERACCTIWKANAVDDWHDGSECDCTI